MKKLLFIFVALFILGACEFGNNTSQRADLVVKNSKIAIMDESFPGSVSELKLCRDDFL